MLLALGYGNTCVLSGLFARPNPFFLVCPKVAFFSPKWDTIARSLSQRKKAKGRERSKMIQREYDCQQVMGHKTFFPGPYGLSPSCPVITMFAGFIKESGQIFLFFLMV